jgi:O-antigen ligase
MELFKASESHMYLEGGILGTLLLVAVVFFLVRRTCLGAA